MAPDVEVNEFVTACLEDVLVPALSGRGALLKYFSNYARGEDVSALEAVVGTAIDWTEAPGNQCDLSANSGTIRRRVG
jgi:hypothetical protein